jgi:AraC-like DNA-binding protein
MKEKIHNPEPLLLTQGYSIDQTYTTIDEMLGCSDNWEHHCTYQLLPSGIKGHHRVLQLYTMQLSFVERLGGMMNDVSSAKGCFSVAVIEENRDKMCFDRIKLKTGDVLFFDDSQAFNLMSNDTIKFCVVNIQKEHLGKIKPLLKKVIKHTLKDKDFLLSKTIQDIWKNRDKTLENTTQCQEDEKKILAVLKEILETQTPQTLKLTKGEKIALDIRDKVYGHMDGRIEVKSLAKEYQVSEKTLQNSFKSLFGFTPIVFLRLLKLNHIHHELKNLSSENTTVSKVALKWGFTHLGYFSKYYTELFGENPSQTLKHTLEQKNGMDSSCVMRQEEMS